MRFSFSIVSRKSFGVGIFSSRSDLGLFMQFLLILNILDLTKNFGTRQKLSVKNGKRDRNFLP